MPLLEKIISTNLLFSKIVSIEDSNVVVGSFCSSSEDNEEVALLLLFVLVRNAGRGDSEDPSFVLFTDEFKAVESLLF